MMITAAHVCLHVLNSCCPKQTLIEDFRKQTFLYNNSGDVQVQKSQQASSSISTCLYQYIQSLTDAAVFLNQLYIEY